MRHRQDIDGLRAVAVVPVVLFHAGVSQIPGGFVGVDIFFVISGYLITSLILGEMSEGRFSLLGFYERRIRRIFPALFTVLAFSSVMALLLFLPRELKSFDRSLIAATFFVSNIHFYDAYAYFAAPVDRAPLLHTWSLSIEEQFYIVFPLLLIVSMSWGRRISTALIAILFTLSLVASIVVTQIDQEAAFYLAPTRVWELMLGALLASGVVPRIESRTAREAFAVAGIALITYALFFFDDIMLFPSWVALIPALGAALVIYAGSDGRQTLVARGLSLSPLVFVGLISYSLYLWHWPLLVFARHWNIFVLSAWQSTIIVVTSFILAGLSWAYIEQPFRRRQSPIPRRWVAACAVTAVAVAVTIGFSTQRAGWPQRFAPETLAVARGISAADKKRDLSRECRTQPSCTLGASVKPTYALWGDSHAAAMLATFADAFAARGFAFKAFIKLGCPPLGGNGYEMRSRGNCLAHNEATAATLESSPEIRTVLLIARANQYIKGKIEGARAPVNIIVGTHRGPTNEQERAAIYERQLKLTVDRMLAAGKTVVLVYPSPEFGYEIPVGVARFLATGRDPAELDLSLAAYREREGNIFSILDRMGNSPKIIRVYPHERLCDAKACEVYANGEALYRDDNHLSQAGAARVLPVYDPVFASQEPSIAKASPEITSALPVNRVSAQQ
jgi:peptidoglycan/LPS O-acetylase OafA/YrhL